MKSSTVPSPALSNTSPPRRSVGYFTLPALLLTLSAALLWWALSQALLVAGLAWVLLLGAALSCLAWLRFSHHRAMLSLLESSRREQEELRSNELQFRAITERAPDAIVVADEKGRIVLVNIQTERLFGYSRQEILGQPVEILVPAAARGRHAAHRDRYTADPHFRQMGEELELKGLHKNGAEFPVEISLSPVRAPGGQWVASSIRDISVRKQLEIQLLQERDRFESLLESAPDGMLVVDAQGMIVFANAQAEALFGYTRQELAGSGLWMLLPHRTRAAHDRLLSEFFEVGRVRQMGPELDLRGLRKNGEEFPVDISLSPIRGAGEPCVCAAVRDVTLRKQAELELRRTSLALQQLNATLETRIQIRTSELKASERRYRLLIENIQDYAIVMLDNQGVVVTWNLGAERITGFTADEIVGHHFSVFHPDDPPALGAGDILRIAATEGRCEEQGWRLRCDGSRYWANEIVSAVRDDLGHLCGFASATQDITVRKQAMDQLESERALAEHANQAKSDFLAVMSHEIRTPMNAILGMAELLHESTLMPEQRQYVEIFRRAGITLLTLINDLLDVAKIEAGHLTLDQTDFNLEELAEQAIELVASKARSKGIGLHLCLLPATPFALRGDPLRLRQILLNLLGNAIKFTDTGEVVLTIGCRTELDRTPVFEFSIRDTGIGIAPAQIDAIFERFVQADSSITRRYGGTGLGLSISRRLVQLMGGDIAISSQESQGSELRFTAHLEIAASDRSGQTLELTDLAGLRALVVDNNSTNRLILRATLHAWGMQTDEFASAAKAIAELSTVMNSSRPYSLVLLDHHMPGMDGFEAARALNLLAPQLPILLLTSDARPGDEDQIREAGIAGRALLPVRRADLLQLIRTALGAIARPASAHSGLSLLPSPQEAGTPALRILIAEDSDDNRMVLRFYLANSPHTLVFAENGDRALHEFQAAPFDLILMDIQMPVMDGLTAVRAIRRAETERRLTPTTILALSANARDTDVHSSLSAGCNAHISKPISKAALLNAIERYCHAAPLPDPSSSDCLDDVRELFGEYLHARREELREMAALIERHDFAQLRRLAHDMKGTASYFGYPHLTELGRVMQVAADSNDSASFRSHYAELADYLWRLSA